MKIVNPLDSHIMMTSCSKKHNVLDNYILECQTKANLGKTLYIFSWLSSLLYLLTYAMPPVDVSIFGFYLYIYISMRMECIYPSIYLSITSMRICLFQSYHKIWGF